MKKKDAKEYERIDMKIKASDYAALRRQAERFTGGNLTRLLTRAGLTYRPAKKP